MGFLRFQQIVIEAGGQRREMPAALLTQVDASYGLGASGDASVTIHNPAPQTVGALREDGAIVDVIAGYVADGPPPGFILSGRVVAGSVRERWPRPDHIVSCMVRPADVRDAGVVTPRAWSSTTGEEVWRYVIDSAGMRQGTQPPGRGADYARGFSVQGDPVKALRVLARDAGWSWSLTHGVVDVWDGDSSRQVPDVAPSTGLIDSAEQIDGGRLRWTCQLRPDIVPGVKVVVVSAVVGRCVVAVDRVDVSTDNRDGSFTTTAEGKLL